MEKLPKIVQARLATAPPDAHPDANLLAAFGENALAVRERGEVLQHLAVCSTCREIVAVAVPEQAEAIAVAAAVGSSAPGMVAVSAPTSPPRRGFSLRWGALAACAVIVAGMVLFTHRSEQKTVAMLPQGSFTPNKAVESRTQEQQPAEVGVQTSPMRAASGAQKADYRESRKVLEKSRDQLADLSKQKASNEMDVANPVAPPPALEAAPVSSGSVVVRALPAAPSAGKSEDKVALDTPVVSAPKQPEEREEKDKKVTASSAFSRSVAPNSTLKADRLSLFVRWTLSDGKLRRSTDAGQTWEAVPLEQDGQFRALSVMGGELWVGGSKGVLYHSADEGTHWSRVVPSAGKELLTEDVLQLEFSDADHGKLITAKGEWKTNNCGSTWRHKMKK